MRSYLLSILCLLFVGTTACSHVSASPSLAGPPPDEITTEVLLDDDVMSMDGNTIGPVDGFVIDTHSHATQYVVVFIKDIYNFGKGAVHEPQDHYLLIPWSHVKLDTANQRVLLDVDATFVDGAPEYSEVPDTSSADWDKEVQLYWKVE